jgi:hypothetical protein
MSGFTSQFTEAGRRQFSSYALSDDCQVSMGASEASWSTGELALSSQVNICRWTKIIIRIIMIVSFCSVQLFGAKYNSVQRIYCNPFPTKTFHGSHCLDFVMIRQPGVDNGAFVVSPDTVWYARALLLFSASAATDTGSKSFEWVLVSTLETYDYPENGNYSNYFTYICYVYYTY